MKRFMPTNVTMIVNESRYGYTMGVPQPSSGSHVADLTKPHRVSSCRYSMSASHPSGARATSYL